MRLERITITSFLGARSVDLRCEAPVVLVCGQNGAGKSSIRDAVALALTGDLGRVSLKKEAHQLITAGADLAAVQITDSDGEIHAASINAAGKLVAASAADPVISLLLDAQKFAQMDATTRRAFLFELMGLRADGPAITERLLARGLDKVKVERISPLLRAGFDSACKEAKSNATLAKGAWRAVTGENYGSEKAKAWKAPVPAYDAAAAQALAAELQKLDGEIAGYQKTIGRLEGERQRRGELSTKITTLQELAGRAERIKVKLATDEAELARLDGELETARAKAGNGKRHGLVHDLAAILSDLLADVEEKGLVNDAVSIDEARVVLGLYEKLHGPLDATGGDPAEANRVPVLEQGRATVARAVENDKRDLEAATRALGEIDALRRELAAGPVDTALLEAKRSTLASWQAGRAEALKKQDTLRAQAAAAAAAEKRTAEAAGHAADVAAWDAIADALAPDGIQAELLGAAMGPLNERLQQSAEDSGWARVMVNLDCEVVVATDSTGSAWRERRLLSESEQWRADAMLAEAIGYVSGARLLVLDRMDVLDLPGRGQLLQWLDCLADNEELGTALVFGTLKALPTGLPPSIQAHWIEHGVAGQLAEAA
jgi:energy-coupling factor transporter ATP-binding protein EcfA2